MSPEYLAQLEQGYQAFVKQTPKQTKKKKSFLVDNISTAGGILGGIVGLRGGVAGAGLGSGAGSALGEALENVITGDPITQNVYKEGAIGGVLGAGPLKLLKASGITAGAATKSANAGRSIRSGVAGVGKVADSYTDEMKILDTIQRRGLSGSGTKLYRTVDGELGKISDEITGILAKSSKTVPRSTLVGDLQKQVADRIPSDSTFSRELTRSLERISKNSKGTIDAQELFAIKKELGGRLNNAFNKLQRGAPLTTKEEVDLALWGQLDNAITKLNPKVKNLTLDQSNLIKARPGFKKSSEKTIGVPLLGIKSGGLERGVQRAKDYTGRTLSGLDAPVSTSPRGIAGRLGAYGAIDGLSGSMPDIGQSTEQVADTGGLEEALAQVEGGQVQSSDDMFAPENIKNNVQSILAQGGTLKDAKEYLSLVDAITKLSGDEPKLSASQKQTLIKANTANALLDSFEQQLGDIGLSDNGPQARVQGITSGITGSLGLNQKAKVYNDLRKGLTTQLAKALGESGALSDQDVARAIGLIPTLGDTNYEANIKLSQLRGIINSIKTGTQNISASQPDNLEDALVNLQ